MSLLSRIMKSAILLIMLTTAATAGIWCSIACAQDTTPTGSPASTAPVVIPGDPSAVVVTMQVVGGMIQNKSKDPFLTVFADGRVHVTDRTTGVRKESKLSGSELSDLLEFVVQGKGFFTLNGAALQAAFMADSPAPVGDGITTTIAVAANGKKNEVSFSSARLYAEQHPKIKLLADYFAVESRLFEVAATAGRPK
jgi:hypothetical protein